MAWTILQRFRVAMVRSERERLSGLRELADQVIDTSALNVHELRQQIRQIALNSASGHQDTGSQPRGGNEMAAEHMDEAVQCANQVLLHCSVAARDLLFQPRSF